MRAHLVYAAMVAALVITPNTSSAKDGPIIEAIIAALFVAPDTNSAKNAPVKKVGQGLSPHHICTPPDHSKARSHACPPTLGHEHRPPFCDPDHDCTPNSFR